MVIQKTDQYVKMNSILSGLTVDWCFKFDHNQIFFKLVQWNHAENKNLPFTCHGHIRICALTYRISSRRSHPYIKTFSTLLGPRLLF